MERRWKVCLERLMSSSNVDNGQRSTCSQAEQNASGEGSGNGYHITVRSQEDAPDTMIIVGSSSLFSGSNLYALIWLNPLLNTYM